jgi:hypothetical protein
MMLNVTNLKAVTNGALTGPALQARQKSIINNAIRELLYSIGYNGPFRDNDMRVQMAVESAIQHLEGPETSTSEHSSLAPVGGSTSAVIDRISNILEKGLEDELLRDSAPVAIKLPEATNVVVAKTKKDIDPSA